jgi:hypothetical protein
MKAILADINVQGHLQVLLSLLEGDEWRELWHSFNLEVLFFRDLGLSPRTSDALLWEMCQQQEMLLLTTNRNADGPDSLEATLLAHNTANSLPVFTIANARRVFRSRSYAERVVVSLLEYLLDIDRVRGVGRLYLP